MSVPVNPYEFRRVWNEDESEEDHRWITSIRCIARGSDVTSLDVPMTKNVATAQYKALNKVCSSPQPDCPAKKVCFISSHL